MHPNGVIIRFFFAQDCLLLSSLCPWYIHMYVGSLYRTVHCGPDGVLIIEVPL